MVELFAGVGGFRLGLEPHGWETVWANQWEPSTKAQHAADCYEAHFGPDSINNEDINEVVKQIADDGSGPIRRKRTPQSGRRFSARREAVERCLGLGRELAQDDLAALAAEAVSQSAPVGILDQEPERRFVRRQLGAQLLQAIVLDAGVEDAVGASSHHSGERSAEPPDAKY